MSLLMILFSILGLKEVDPVKLLLFTCRIYLSINNFSVIKVVSTLSIIFSSVPQANFSKEQMASE